MEKIQSTAYVLGNRYQIQQTLGTGGMSVVYLAKDLMLERPIALKLLRPDLSRSEDFCNQFKLEAKAAAILSHPNIVTVHDFGIDHSRLFIVMEYVNGSDLKTRLKKNGMLDIQKGLYFMIQACAGLGYAHRAGLVHCDVKPQNMMITGEDRLKITDFGLSRALSSINPSEKLEVVWGSPQYLSPEQASGLAPSPASDVYSLGVTLYELLTGQPPFVSNDSDELVRMHRETVPVSPKIINREIPEELNQIIMKVLSKEPAGRYRTADQFGRVLTSFYKSYSAYRNHSVSNGNEKFAQKNNIPPQKEEPVSSTKPVKLRLSTPGQKEVIQEAKKYDWSTISLALVTLLVTGGLIPFWLYIWFSFKNPTYP